MVLKNKKFLVSVDPSLRSSGIVVLDRDTKLIERMEVIKTNPDDEEFGEELLLGVQTKLLSIIKETCGKNPFDFVIEGLAFNAKNKQKDLIDALHWMYRTTIWKKYTNAMIGVISVEEWRSTVISKDDREKFREKFAKSIFLKEAVLSKLPPFIRSEFDYYVAYHNMDHASLYDLSDAYFLGLYRLSLYNNTIDNIT